MKPPPNPARGFVLLEIIIALTVFAVAVTGLSVALHGALDASNRLRRQAALRRGMESTLAEARQMKKREEMQLQRTDEALAMNYQTTLEELKWTNAAGNPVRGLYQLRVLARPAAAPDQIEDSAEIHVYRP